MRGLFYSIGASDLAIDEELTRVAPSLSPRSKEIVTLMAPEIGRIRNQRVFGDQIKGHLGRPGYDHALVDSQGAFSCHFVFTSVFPVSAAINAAISR